MKLKAIVPVLLLISGTLHAQRAPIPQEAGGARVTVVRSDEGGVTLDVTGLRASVDRSDGAGRIVHNAPLFASYGDSLSLPGIMVTLGVPQGATGFTATVTPTSFDTLALPSAASYTTAIPAGTAAVGVPIVMRGLNTVALRYQPLRYEPGRVITERSARIVISWKRGASAPKGGEVYRESRSMQEVLRAQILNYDAAKGWALRPARSSRSLLGTSGWGMERAVVLGTGRDGAYRASGSELAASGAQGIVGSPISALRLRNRTTPVGFYIDDRDGDGLFDGGDYLEFEGRRNPSAEGFYLDDFTDTNAYILSWSGGAGGGPALAPKDGHASAPAMTAYDSTLHFEKDNLYFYGTTISAAYEPYTLYVSERVPGERFYWERIVFPFQSQVEFNCSPYYTPGGRVKLRMRMLGITDTLHHIDLQLNGSPASSIVVRKLADTLVELDIPVSHLINGRNTMTFVPKAPPGVDPGSYTYTDHVYLDYIEIQGRWLPSSFDDAPKLRLPSTGGGARRVAITGLTAPPTHALSPASRIPIDSVERGVLFRLTSREFDNVALRQAPGFFAQLADSTVTSPLYGVGLMLVEADGATGRLSRSKFFSLDPANGAALADAVRFLNDALDGNIVIAGLSVGTSSTPFSQELKDALAGLGSTKASEPNFVAGWLFAVKKGSPASAVEGYAPYGPGDPGLTLDAFFPSPDGPSYRAVVTLDGAPGEEFQIGAPMPPTMRYHGADVLVGTGNRADMLLITHPAFAAEANRLAAHRAAHDSLDVRVIDVNTIYDEFNNGIKSPVAIRRFLHYADTNWTAPAPGFVLLFGDASWDAANRFGRPGNADYIPTNGIPASDYIYTVPFGDEQMMWHQLIGRLSVASASDARAVVDKLIEYDTLPPAAWNKRFVFMAGGNTAREVAEHHDENLQFATQYVLSPSFHGDTAMIRRTSANLAFPDSKDAPWAQEEMNRGAVWASFTGHGYTDGFDLDFGFPEQFDNPGRYFVLGTFSCQTGAFAEPGLPVRNERFVNYPGKGAIAAIGGTSFSMPDVDRPMKEGFYAAMTESRDRVLGSIFTRAKYDWMFRSYAVGWDKWTEGQNHRNALVMYNLLGDPAMKLAFRNSVELAFTDVRLNNEAGGEPTPGDSVVKVHARLWNYGLPPQGTTSVTVRTVATITDRQQRSFSDTVDATVGSYADLVLTLPLGKDPGEYIVRLDADPERTLQETYLPDNDTTLTLRVRGNQPLPIEPLPYGRVAGYDNVVIRLVNPPSGPGAEITVDTTDAFDPASSITSTTTGTMQLEELTTTWTFSIPQSLRGARRFWWRAVSTRDTVAARLFPLVETFTVDEAAGREYMIGGVRQMADAQIRNLVNEPEGVGPGERSVPILVMSMGQSRFSPTDPNPVPRTSTFVRVDGQEQNSPALDNLNVLVLDSGRVREKKAFALYNGGAERQRFLDMVAAIPPGLTVLVWANGASFNDSGAHASSAVRQGLKMLGSTKADSLGEEDSYALIGGKGIDPSLVKEAWARAAELRAAGSKPPFYVSVTDTIIAPAGAGMLTAPVVGPATAWRSVEFPHTGNGRLRASVFGVNRSGTRDSLFEADVSGPVSLAGVDVDRYPRLEFHLHFSPDTTLRLGAIAADFDPSPELALVPSTARMENDSVLQGDRGTLNATVVNLSRKYAADNVLVRLTSTDATQAKVYDSLVVGHLAPLDSVRNGYTIETERLKGYNGFRLLANPADRPAEPYQQNNIVEATLRVGLDNVSPELTIYADNTRLMDGDYVNPRPLFEIRIFDNSSLKLDDSSTIEMILDNDIIRLGYPGTGFQQASEKGSLRAIFSYRPDSALANGRHEMRLASVDATGNVDTTDFIPFFVERDLNIHNVVNYPNPFIDKTTFTFMVGGAVPPKSGEIAIFTVAGRRIKTIRLGAAQMNIGFNRVDWDGLDGDGDRLANGVYLYRVTIDNGEAKQEVIEKLVVMR